jgi:dTDP-4-amino-4,6-dideoxygalactose transaminase
VIRIGDLQFESEERAALQRVIDSGRISEGPEVRAFEREYADWLGVKYCVAVSSGTAALICGLTAMKYDPRYDVRTVVLPALTFIATANSVVLSGLTPAFEDVDPDTFCLDLSVGDYMWDRSHMIIPVHLFGYPVDMDKLIGGKPPWQTDCPIIVEDACESHGTLYKGVKTGTFGLWSAFSFYIAHTVQAGEFGCVCTNDTDIAQACRRIKAHGRVCACNICTRNTSGCFRLKRGEPDPRFRSLYPGYNFKPMEWQAAIARCQLAKIDQNLQRRLWNVGTLNRLLEPIAHKVQLPPIDGDVAYMAYPLVLREPGKRDSVIRTLSQNGVESRPLFGCIPSQQPAYSEYKDLYNTPVADYAGANGFYVGCHQYMTGHDVKEMARVIIETVKGL